MLLAINKREGDLCSVDHLLRKLYTLGLNWLLVVDRDLRWLLHKERLIAYMGMGEAAKSVIDVVLNREKPIAEMPSPEEDDLLMVDRADCKVVSWSSLISDDKELPLWWNVPMPVARVSMDDICFNEEGARLCPDLDMTEEEKKALLSQGDIILTSSNQQQLSFQRMKGNYFILEDISQDISVAEDVSWWGGVGKALVDRFRKDGYCFDRIDAISANVSENGEFLPCGWNGQLMGYIKIYKER